MFSLIGNVIGAPLHVAGAVANVGVGATSAVVGTVAPIPAAIIGTAVDIGANVVGRATHIAGSTVGAVAGIAGKAAETAVGIGVDAVQTVGAGVTTAVGMATDIADVAIKVGVPLANSVSNAVKATLSYAPEVISIGHDVISAASKAGMVALVESSLGGKAVHESIVDGLVVTVNTAKELAQPHVDGAVTAVKAQVAEIHSELDVAAHEVAQEVLNILEIDAITLDAIANRFLPVLQAEGEQKLTEMIELFNQNSDQIKALTTEKIEEIAEAVELTKGEVDLLVQHVDNNIKEVQADFVAIANATAQEIMDILDIEAITLDAVANRFLPIIQAEGEQKLDELIQLFNDNAPLIKSLTTNKLMSIAKAFDVSAEEVNQLLDHVEQNINGVDMHELTGQVEAITANVIDIIYDGVGVDDPVTGVFADAFSTVIAMRAAEQADNLIELFSENKEFIGDLSTEKLSAIADTFELSAEDADKFIDSLATESTDPQADEPVQEVAPEVSSDTNESQDALGADTFEYNLSEKQEVEFSTQVIDGFDPSVHRLDISDILVHEGTMSADDLVNHLSFSTNENGNTEIAISIEGEHQSGDLDVDHVIEVVGIDVTAGNSLSDLQIVNNLLESGHLIVD